MPSAFALRYDSDTESPARTPRERRSSDSDAESGSSGEAQGYGAAGKGTHVSCAPRRCQTCIWVAAVRAAPIVALGNPLESRCLLRFSKLRAPRGVWTGPPGALAAWRPNCFFFLDAMHRMGSFFESDITALRHA